VPQTVGELYDRLTMSEINDGGFTAHIGLWDTPDSEAPLEEAVARIAEVVIARVEMATPQISRCSTAPDCSCAAYSTSRSRPRSALARGW
jgi:hypothetical protein